MLHYTDYVKNMMVRYNYPEEAIALFTEVEKRLDNEKEFGDRFDAIFNEYYFPEAGDLRKALDAIEVLAKDMGLNECTLEFVFIMNCTEVLKGRYEAAGIPEKIFWDSTDDLRCKLLECIECEHVPGTFVAGWNAGFLAMKRFAYGRFQYEINTYDWDHDFVTSCGKVLKAGDTYINFHIPSSGIPLTDEVRLASYKEAYKHYVHLFPDGKVVFGCGSWLLFPKHREFLPERLNIRRFMDDFEIVGWAEKDNFGNDWRVFGHWTEYPPEQWPRDTALRKAYAEWVCAGHKTGDGFGVFVFDGEKILR